MKSVDPIRDIKKVNAIKTYLRGKDIRDYTMFVLGINIALRISDLLQLKWGDVLKVNKRTFKDICIIESKTRKKRKIKLNTTCKKALIELLDSLDTYTMDDYIFKSREGNMKPISRQQALNIIKGAAKAVGVKDNVGTHTLRKTWGYHAWKKGFSPTLIMDTLNHSNLNVTKRYLGITQDDINDLYDSLNI